MKRFALILTLFLTFFQTSLFSLADIYPTYKSTVPKNIYGFLQVENSFDIYKQPDFNSKKLGRIKVKEEDVYKEKKEFEAGDVFAVFVPEKNLAFCWVLDEKDGWYKILYDKNKALTGWVKPDKAEDFLTLKSFYSYYGKKNSLYYLRDVDVRTRSLRSAPSDTSQALSGINVAKNIKLVIIKGNWALVKVIDYGTCVPKTGYLKWRDSDGSLLLFPKLN